MAIATASCGCRRGKQWLDLVHWGLPFDPTFRATILAPEPALPSFNLIALNYGTPTSVPTAFESVRAKVGRRRGAPVWLATSSVAIRSAPPVPTLAKGGRERREKPLSRLSTLLPVSVSERGVSIQDRLDGRVVRHIRMLTCQRGSKRGDPVADVSTLRQRRL
jgi:hypothetical protein